MSWEHETVQYYNWLMRIKTAEFEKELLKIISFLLKINQSINFYDSPST